MERLILDGRDIDMDRLVDPGKRLKIEEFSCPSKDGALILSWNISAAR